MCGNGMRVKLESKKQSSKNQSDIKNERKRRSSSKGSGASQVERFKKSKIELIYPLPGEWKSRETRGVIYDAESRQAGQAGQGRKAGKVGIQGKCTSEVGSSQSIPAPTTLSSLSSHCVLACCPPFPRLSSFSRLVRRLVSFAELMWPDTFFVDKSNAAVRPLGGAVSQSGGGLDSGGKRWLRTVEPLEVSSF